MTSRRFSRALTIAIVVAPGAARADDRATAQQLFEQGKRLMGAGDVAEACKKFEGAADLSQTPGVRLNLAECWERLGRTASAWATYDEAIALAERAGDTAAAEVAKKGRSALDPRLSYIKVMVPKEVALPGLALTRDGMPLPEGAWGTAVPVDPGTHEIAAQAPGRVPWSERRDVTGAGSIETITVPALVERASTSLEDGAKGLPPPAPVQDGSGGRRQTQHTLALVAAGMGALGVGIGSYFGLQALSKRNDYRTHLGADGQCLDMTCQTSSHDAASAGTASTIAFVAGGVFVAAGAVLWFSAPATPAGSAMRISPMAGPTMGGLAMAGSF